MARYHLFHMPGACSRVVLSALEEVGAAYEDRAVNILRGEQRTPGLLAQNPKGKVPALGVDDDMLTENAAILIYLAEQHPQARLLPSSADPMTLARARSDLIWISNTLHPKVRTYLLPAHVSSADADGVRAVAGAQLQEIFIGVEARLACGDWWDDAGWSIIDVYLYWAASTAVVAGFSLDDYPAIRAHGERVRARPSFQRALAREQAAQQASGIELPPGARL